jgi:transcriptional antiterminator
LERYKLERKRRRQVQLLAEKGLGQKGIARELGVSTRTVKRDWKKLSRYIKGQFNRQVWEINARQLEKERQRYEGLTIKEELKLIKKDLKALKKRHLL